MYTVLQEELIGIQIVTILTFMLPGTLQECDPIKLTFALTFGSYLGVFIIYDISATIQACPLNLRSLISTVNKVHLIFHYP